MDLGSPSFSVCVIMISLLGAAVLTYGDNNNCQCPEIPHVDLTKQPGTCFQINTSFRYKCIDGYVREAGTSNLIRCKQSGSDSPQWLPSPPTLKCIPDPKRTTTRPPNITQTQGYTDIPLNSTSTTTVTAAETTQSESPPASVTAEKDSTEPTSPGMWTSSDHSPAGKVDDRTETEPTQRTSSTSTTTEPSNSGSSQIAQKSWENTRGTHTTEETTSTTTSTISLSLAELDSTTTAMIGFASVVIVCAVIGVSFFFYRRRLKNDIHMPTQTPEEQMPMNRVSSE